MLNSTIRRRVEMPRAIFSLVILLLVVSSTVYLVLGLPLALVPKGLREWKIEHQVLIIPLAGICIGQLGLIYLQLVRRYDKHKGIRVIAQRERPFDNFQTWSTHLGSPMIRSVIWRLRRIFLFWMKNDTYLRVLKHKVDREIANSKSTQAFLAMLEEHHAKPGVLIISASLLNRRNRSGSRLQERIDVVASQPDWRCEMVVRELNLLLSLASRFQFGWKSVPGEKGGRFQAPGIVAWRAADGEISDAKWQARLKALGLRVATGEEFNSPVFSG